LLSRLLSLTWLFTAEEVGRDQNLLGMIAKKRGLYSQAEPFYRVFATTVAFEFCSLMRLSLAASSDGIRSHRKDLWRLDGALQLG
jgi:hypothetical protein